MSLSRSAFFATVLAASVSLAGPPTAPTPLPETTATFLTASGARVSFKLEVASRPADRLRGLMFRHSLAPDRGMLFVFPRDEVQGFYMKNTYVPLDMVFVNGAGVVAGVVENARPLTLDTRGVKAPSRYVIELRAFTARSRGIGAGAIVTFDPPPPTVDE